MDLLVDRKNHESITKTSPVIRTGPERR